MAGLDPIETTMESITTSGEFELIRNIELRKNLFKKASMAVFLDFGNVWLETISWDFNLFYSIGAGIRYDTVIGPLRIDFAWKLNKQVHDKDNYQIHLNIGQAF